MNQCPARKENLRSSERLATNYVVGRAPVIQRFRELARRNQLCPLALDEERPCAYNITYRKDGVHVMATATVTSKGQTTIPKEVRAAANLKPGDKIHFAVLEDGTIIVRVKNRSIRDIAFKPPGGKRVSIAQMNR